MESNKEGRFHVLVGVTGGIAAGKALQVVSALHRDADVRVMMTPAATSLIAPLAFESMSGHAVAVDTFSREFPHEIQHIAWAQWAHAVLIAPVTANTIGKLACGIADNLLTTTVLAVTSPLVLVPAMNADMYAHPAVQSNLETLRERGAVLMEPVDGHLACGVTGKGRMPEPADIVRFFWNSVLPDQLLKGRRILVTAGPTREPIDPVRYLTNRSSGKMGYALAEQARAMGAEVTLVSGPVALTPPYGIRMVQVETARQMHSSVMEEKSSQDIIICCAAVSDYEPVEAAGQKLKKKEKAELELRETPDILAALGAHKSCYLVGFAAETRDVLRYAKEKLERKNLDMIVANDVSDAGIGFDSAKNEVTILTRNRPPVFLQRAPKPVIAKGILTVIAEDFTPFEGCVS